MVQNFKSRRHNYYLFTKAGVVVMGNPPSIYNYPVREGCRGGHDKFNWEDVKNDKQRGNYLGNSIKAPDTRWTGKKDLFWYTKEKSATVQEDDVVDEVARIKQMEEEMMGSILKGKVKKQHIERVEDEKRRSSPEGRSKERRRSKSPERRERRRYKSPERRSDHASNR